MKYIISILYILFSSLCFSQEELEYNTYTVNWMANCTSYSNIPALSNINLYLDYEFSDGNLLNLDRLWIPGVDIQANGRVSIVNPTSTNLTEVNSITWTQNKGYTGNGTNMYLNTNYVASTDAVKYTTSNMAVGIYAATSSGSSTTSPFGADGTGATHGLFGGSTTTVFEQLNGGGQNSTSTTGGVNSGNWVWYQTGFNVHANIAQNGTTLLNSAATPVAIPTITMFVFNRNVSGVPQAGQYATGRYSMIWIGNWNNLISQNRNAHELALMQGW